jgi:hypothetical protein
VRFSEDGLLFSGLVFIPCAIAEISERSARRAKSVLVFEMRLEKITTPVIFGIGFAFKTKRQINRRYFQELESVLLLKIRPKNLTSLLISRNGFAFAPSAKISAASAKSWFSQLAHDFPE